MVDTKNNSVFMSYADSNGLTSSKTWTLKNSSLGGRGIFAQRNLPPNCELFREKALVVGPRSDPRCPAVCVGCHRTGRLRLCSSGCGLPVCEKICEKSLLHKECGLMCILKSGPELDTKQRLALVAPLRAVFLSARDREILQTLEGHDKVGHKELLQRLELVLKPEDLSLVQTCLQVIDATAFETPSVGDGGGSLRGIYPAAAMMNHDCVPNTRHCFDNLGHMVVETTRSVAEGEELTTTYTCLTWGTQARRAHLLTTKRFMCRCRRCLDPSEFGARLMALYCMKKGCGGMLLPGDGELNQLPWNCVDCGVKVPVMRVAIIQKMIGEAISDIEGGNPKEACRVLRKNTLVPGSNHVAVEFKLSLTRLYGNEKGFTWSELTDDDLILKQLVCVELLYLFSLLGLGLCRQRGHVLLELAATLREVERRGITEYRGIKATEIPYYGNIVEIYKEAKDILRQDASAATALRKADISDNGSYKFDKKVSSEAREVFWHCGS